MKTITKVAALALTLSLLAGAEAKAQNWFWGAQYQTSLAMGDTKDFTNSFSWRNFGIEGRALLNREATMSAGLFFGWNVMNDETTDLINFDNFDVSGYQFRYVNAFPILATAHYYLGRRGKPRAFIGAGAGTYYIENRLEIGTVAIVNKNWHLGLAPEVGFVLPFNRQAATYLSVKYNYAVKSGGVTHSYMTFGIGIGSM